MFDDVNATELVVFTILFVAVSALGFVAARWRRAETLDHLDKWGLGGRSFGSWITWFLIGGDLYTAYTFVAVPALVFGAGAIGFFAVPYTIVVYPMLFLVLIRHLWTRNIYKEYLNTDATPKQEARSSKLASLVVKVGALLAILGLDPQFSIDLQLIGGIIILQTLPAVALGLYTRWFHRWGLIAGWAAGMAVGFWTTFQIQQRVFNEDGSITVVKEHFGGSGFPLAELGIDTTVSIYAGFLALLANLVVGAVATFVFRAMKVAEGEDRTRPDEYFADMHDPRVHDIPEVVH